MSLKNYVDKMQNHSHTMESKLAIWRSKKKRGSKGEQITRDFLKKHNLAFKEQKSFSDLYYKNPNFLLRFDFQVWYKDFWFLLEIDGGFHFKPIKINENITNEQAQLNFEEGQERDKLKNEYCESHNIRLERIVWDGNKNKLIKNLQILFRNL